MKGGAVGGGAGGLAGAAAGLTGSAARFQNVGVEHRENVDKEQPPGYYEDEGVAMMDGSEGAQGPYSSWQGPGLLGQQETWVWPSGVKAVSRGEAEEDVEDVASDGEGGGGTLRDG